jgi:hypothetical protein
MTAPTPEEPPAPKRTPARRWFARQLAKHLRAERPDYAYLKQVFRHLREELGVEIERAPKKLPYVPSEKEIRSFYEAVWIARRSQDVVMIKTLLYTGVRVLLGPRGGSQRLEAAGHHFPLGRRRRAQPWAAAPARGRPRGEYGDARNGAANRSVSSWEQESAACLPTRLVALQIIPRLSRVASES